MKKQIRRRSSIKTTDISTIITTFSDTIPDPTTSASKSVPTTIPSNTSNLEQQPLQAQLQVQQRNTKRQPCSSFYTRLSFYVSSSSSSFMMILLSLGCTLLILSNIYDFHNHHIVNDVNPNPNNATNIVFDKDTSTMAKSQTTTGQNTTGQNTSSQDTSSQNDSLQLGSVDVDGAGQDENRMSRSGDDNGDGNDSVHVPLIFYKMYQRAKLNQQWCMDNDKSTTNTVHSNLRKPSKFGFIGSNSATATASANGDGNEFKFDFLQDWETRMYPNTKNVNATNHDKINITTTSNVNINEKKPQTSSTYTVILSYTPPLPSSSSTTSSTFTKIKPPNYRVLFINLISLLTYKHVQKIIILYHEHENNDIHSLKQDTQYGKRIWEWHTNHSHPVQILTKDDMNITSTTSSGDGDTAETAVQNLFDHVLFPFHPHLLQHIPHQEQQQQQQQQQQQHQTILYLNQNDNDEYYTPSNLLLVQENGTRIMGGEETFLAGFELYRTAHPFRNDTFDNVVEETNHSVSSNANILDDNDKDDDDSLSLPPFVGRDEMIEMEIPESFNIINNMTMEGKTFLPTCRTTTMETTKAKTATTKLKIMSASGMFLSTDYFSLIWHPILQPYRTFVQNKYHQVRTTIFDNNKDTSTTTSSNTKHTNVDAEANVSSIHSKLNVIQSIAVSTIVAQLSGRNIPLVYPTIRQTWDGEGMEEGTTISNSNEDGGGDGGDGGDEKQSRRLSVDMDGTIGSSVLNTQFQDGEHSYNNDDNNNDDNHHRRRRRRRRQHWDISKLEDDHGDTNNHHNHVDRFNTNIERESSSSIQNRRLQQSQQSNSHESSSLSKKRNLLSHQDYEFLLSCRRYFGSYISRTKCWCDDDITTKSKSTNFDEKINVELDCQSKCHVKSDELFTSMLPWMKQKQED